MREEEGGIPREVSLVQSISDYLLSKISSKLEPRILY